MIATVLATPAQADSHDRDEQLIRSLIVFNGSGYSRTFNAESSDTIYLLADTDNFVTLRKTFVFYRPADDALHTDTTLLDEPVDGFLEIVAQGGAAQSFSMQDYTYYNLRGDGAARWRTATGPEAHRVYSDYTQKLRAYREGLDAYRLDRATYEYMVAELERRIEQQKRAGGDIARLEEVLRGLVAPTGPEFPEEYAAAPVRVDRAFVVNLPPGRYRTRLVRGDGKVLEGSEKEVVAFGRFGEPTVGYEVIPADKWNRPVESNSRHSVVYVDGSSDLYLVAYHQHEFIDLYYEKLLRNDARGSPGLRRHVFVQEIPGLRMAVLDAGRRIAIIDKLPWFVEQERTASHGYRIVPFDPEGAHDDRKPSLQAFHIDLDRYGARFRVALVDGRGDIIAGSMRRIRVPNGSTSAGVLLLAAFLPLAVGIGVTLARWRITSA
ncbi:MAG: hypothetical protein OXP69_19820 [Spirochaetaceae bacterium]|nr:hypothetical protein [Spirochaetaceae bacterium]